MNLIKLGKFYYLSNQSVFKENSTTKICPVFYESAQQGNFSLLNDCVEKGPNLIEMILTIFNSF